MCFGFLIFFLDCMFEKLSVEEKEEVMAKWGKPQKSVVKKKTETGSKKLKKAKVDPKQMTIGVYKHADGATLGVEFPK